MRFPCSLLSLAALSLFAATPGLAQNAGLDPAFADGGIAILDLGSTEQAGDAALLPDGRFLVAGQARGAASTDWSVARLTAGGALDASFGDGGRLVTDFDGGFDYATVVLPLADGRFVVAGTAEFGGLSAWVLTRHLEDGALDASFGTGGQVTLVDPAAGEGRLSNAAFDADGRIVVTGLSTQNDYLVARFTADGQPDISFGTAGLVTLPYTGVAAVPEPLASGQILVGGRTEASRETRLVRLDADGALDASFGTGGEAIINFSSGDEEIESVEELASGHLLVTARADAGSRGNWAVARTDAFGALDPAFGIDGVRVFPFDAQQFFAEPAPALVRADGSLVMAGALPGAFGQADAGLSRLSADGLIDLGLGTFGVLRTEVGENDRPEVVLAQPDGKLVVFGTRYGRTGLSDHFAIRYAADLPTAPFVDATDRAFGADGTIPAGALVGEQPDGRIVAGRTELRRFSATGDADGTFGTGGSTGALPPFVPALRVLGDGASAVVGSESVDLGGTPTVLPRIDVFTPDGQPDASFGTDGSLYLTAYADAFAAGAGATGIARQPDGKWIVVGSGSGAGPRFFVSRLDADGTPDASFGTDGTFYAELSQVNTDGGRAVRVLDDGSILATAKAGYLVKLTPFGTLDVSFGGENGFAPGVASLFVQFGSFNYSVNNPDFRIEADGAIIVGGWSGPAMVALRLTAAGLPADGENGLMSVLPVLATNAATFLPEAPGFAWALNYRVDLNDAAESFAAAVVLADASGRPLASEGVNGILAADLPGNQFVSGGLALSDGGFLVASSGQSVRLVPSALQNAVDDGPETAAVLALAAFPNPATGAVTVALPGFTAGDRAGAARVEVLDVLGRRVALLHDGPAVPEVLRWEAQVPAGVYLIRLTGETVRAVQAVTIAR